MSHCPTHIRTTKSSLILDWLLRKIKNFGFLLARKFAKGCFFGGGQSVLPRLVGPVSKLGLHLSLNVLLEDRFGECLHFVFLFLHSEVNNNNKGDGRTVFHQCQNRS